MVAAFRGAGFDDLTVLARNPEAGPALAERYDYAWLADEPARLRRHRQRHPARDARDAEDVLAFTDAASSGHPPCSTSSPSPRRRR